MSGTLVLNDPDRTEARPEPGAGASKRRLDDQFLRAQRLESIGMLASGIAHDLNNVLAPIILAAPVLREHATNPDDLRIIASLEKSAERGVDLVRQILSFTHGEGGGHQIVEVKCLLQETMSVVNETFPKNIRLDKSFPDDLWPVMADPTQIHQVLLNLCVNARDAMPSGGVLSLRAENCMLDERAAKKIEGGMPGAWLVLHVEDTGTGIPPEAIEHIWEPFFTTKDANKGTGLGLSTVRGIVESHRGFIGLKTQIGRGTTFRVYLPAAELPAKSGQLDPVRPSAARGNGELVLIVDDEAQIRDITAAILSRHGYRVLIASDGSEAVALFAARISEISVVVTDVSMPNLDGAVLAGILKHLKPDVKILAMSGLSSDTGDSKMSRYTGAFLFKPFKVEALLDAVSKLLHPELVTEVA
ncbi:MAG: ATP-binding protein [Opitutaceae bacterium]|jgi:nitrogen-specific signal transduction histidine kinase/ActR/RegA family two-component response regulator